MDWYAHWAAEVHSGDVDMARGGVATPRGFLLHPTADGGHTGGGDTAWIAQHLHTHAILHLGPTQVLYTVRYRPRRVLPRYGHTSASQKRRCKYTKKG